MDIACPVVHGPELIYLNRSPNMLSFLVHLQKPGVGGARGAPTGERGPCPPWDLKNTIFSGFSSVKLRDLHL